MMLWKSYFELGIVHYMLFPELLDQEEHYVESLELLCTDPYFDVVEISPIKDKELRKQVQELLNDAGLRVVYNAQPMMLKERLNLASLDEKTQLKAINALKEVVDQAYELNAARLVLMDGPLSYPGLAKEEEALIALKEALGEICAYAQSQGKMTLSIETFDRTIEKRCLLGPTEIAAKLVRQVREEYGCLGLTLDMAHLGLLGEDPQEMIKQAQDILVHVHVGNCVRDRRQKNHGDSHPVIGSPGGMFDANSLAQFLRTLLEVGFLRTHNREPAIISFEVRSEENPAIYLAHCKRSIDRAWALAH